MSDLPIYHEILFLNLRPSSKFAKQSDMKFKQLTVDLNKEFYLQQPKYEVVFIKPLSNIRKYYSMLIEYEAIKYLNKIHKSISESTNKNEKIYHVHWALTRTIQAKIKETSNIIQANELNIDEQNFSNEAYIFNLLKHHLVRLYIEIQDIYKDFVKEDILSIQEVYIKYFNDSDFKESYIIEAKQIQGLKLHPIQEKVESKPAFQAIKDDFRDNKKGIYTYESLIKNSSRFATLEEQLYSEGLIDENYNFIDIHGKKKYFAALYHQIIRKGYFKERIFPDNEPFKPLFARKFLDYRYNVDIDKQFRNWAKKEDELLSFIEKNYFLDHIPAC